jgi:hypothetical protein
MRLADFQLGNAGVVGPKRPQNLVVRCAGMHRTMVAEGASAFSARGGRPHSLCRGN